MKALASGSTGNAYMLGKLLIECGIPYTKILKKGGWVTPKSCLITHYHSDHAKYAKEVAKHGCPIYASAGTLQELDIPDHRKFLLKPNETYLIQGWEVTPYSTSHCCGSMYFILEKGNRKLLFSTDNTWIDEDHDNLTEIYIEANYSDELVSEEIDPTKLKAAISHMSLEDCIKWLKSQDLSQVSKIVLLHLSSNHACPEDFIEKVQKETGIPTYGAIE